MIPIVLTAVVLGGTLVWALYAEAVPPRPRFRPARLPATATGADVRDHDFPLVVGGYDPRWVDAHLQQVGALVDHLRGGRPPAQDGPVARPATVPPPPGASTRDLAAVQALRPDGGPGSVLDG